MNNRFLKSGIQTLQNVHRFRLYWIFLPSLLIWLGYFVVQFQSQSFFDYFHEFDTISIFGWEWELKSYISGVEWFYFLILFELFKFIILTLLSPFNAYISEKYDQKLTGNQFKFSWSRMIEDIFRGLIISITGFSLEMFLTILWLLINLILPFEGLTPVILLLISSFFFGFAYMDYSLERHRFDIIQSWQFAFKNGKTCFTIGLIFSLIMLIPHAGIILAPPLITLYATNIFLTTNSQ
ncbi:MAG: hypothetical protein KDC84_06685 [Crocinitomicaceae bacterium]|nr:hypothetical protein [Crocinitomicaceae bacterium]